MSDLAKNLRFLCSMRRSVSDVARDLDINRSQLTKYLSATAKPSAHNLFRIATYFGVRIEILYFEHDQFLAAIGAKRRLTNRESIGTYLRNVFPGDLNRLRPLIGLYHSYFLAPTFEGVVTRSLISLFESDGMIYSKDIEKSGTNDQFRRGYLSKYNGLVAMHAGRIFVVEHEYLTGDTVTETILHTQYRAADMLTGMTFGTTAEARRLPYSSPVVWRPLRRGIGPREAIRSCGFLPIADRSIDPRIRSFLQRSDQLASIAT